MTGIPWDDPYLEFHAAEHVEPKPNPVCPICGAGMAIKRFEGDAVLWHCDGAIGRDTWGRRQRVEGHWRNDGHALTSQVARRRCF